MVKSWWFLHRACIARGYPEGHLPAAVKGDSLTQPITGKRNGSLALPGKGKSISQIMCGGLISI